MQGCCLLRGKAHALADSDDGEREEKGEREGDVHPIHRVCGGSSPFRRWSVTILFSSHRLPVAESGEAGANPISHGIPMRQMIVSRPGTT